MTDESTGPLPEWPEATEPPEATESPGATESPEANESPEATESPELGEPPLPAEPPESGASRPDEEAMPPHLADAYRRLSRRLAIIVTLIAVVVLAAAAAIGATAISRRFEAARKLDRAQQLVEQADAVVLDLDGVVRGQLGDVLAERASAVSEQVPGARDALEEAVVLIDEAQDSVTDDEQENSRLLRAAAKARLKMLEPAGAILEANTKAGRALEPAKQGWTLVLAAEKVSDQAVQEYNLLTKEGVNKSSQLSGQAEDTLKNARAYFSEAATAFPDADFQRYLVFVDGKIALLQISKQSNAAWLAGKLPEANALIARYNAEEQKVIVIAKTLPSTPGKAIADAYDRLVADDTKQYFEAREEATKADAALDRF